MRLSERQVKPKQMNVLFATHWPHAQLLLVNKFQEGRHFWLHE